VPAIKAIYAYFQLLILAIYSLFERTLYMRVSKLTCCILRAPNRLKTPLELIISSGFNTHIRINNSINSINSNQYEVLQRIAMNCERCMQFGSIKNRVEN
jgi:hypothetical protein